MTPESYVVRIYRRDPNHPDRMEGILITVEAEGGQAFHSGAELLRLLTLVAENAEAPSPGQDTVTVPAKTNEDKRR